MLHCSNNPSFLNFSPFQWRSTISNTKVVVVWLEKHLESKNNFTFVIQYVFFITISSDKYNKLTYFSYYLSLFFNSKITNLKYIESYKKYYKT